MLARSIPQNMLTATYLAVCEHEKSVLAGEDAPDEICCHSVVESANEHSEDLDHLGEFDAELFRSCAEHAHAILGTGNTEELCDALLAFAPNPSVESFCGGPIVDEDDDDDESDDETGSTTREATLRQAEDGHAIRVSKVRDCPKVKQSEYRPLVNNATQPNRYRNKVQRANRFHAIHHLTPAMTELTIRANPGIGGLEQGDSRYTGPCEYCERNKVTFRRTNESDGSIPNKWHTYGIGECVYMDTKVLSVTDRVAGCSYAHIFVTAKGKYKIVVPVKSLDTENLLAALQYVVQFMKIRYGIDVKHIITDSFSTFKEQHRLAVLKAELGSSIDCMPPHVKQWNEAELAIKMLLAGARIRLTALGDLSIAGQTVDPSELAISAMHTAACQNTTGNSGLETSLHVHNTPDEVLASVHCKRVWKPELYPFGCLATVKDSRSGKLDPIDIMCRYLGPASYSTIRDRTSEQSKSHHFLDISDKSGRRLVTSGQFTSHVNQYLRCMPGVFTGPPDISLPKRDDQQEASKSDDDTPDVDNDEPEAPVREPTCAKPSVQPFKDRAFSEGCVLLYLLHNETTGKDEFTPVVLVKQNYLTKPRSSAKKIWKWEHNTGSKLYNDETVWQVCEEGGDGTKFVVTLSDEVYQKLWKFRGQSVSHASWSHAHVIDTDSLHPGLSSLMKKALRIKRVRQPRRVRDVEPRHRALNTAEYVQQGGSLESFLAEIQSGDVILDGAASFFSSSMLLDKIEHADHRPVFEGLLMDRIEKIDHLAECYLHSESLWEQPLPNHYHALKHHGKAFMHDCPNDHLFGSRIDCNEPIADYLRTYGLDHQAQVFLQFEHPAPSQHQR